MRHPGVFCLHCGGYEKLALPKPIQTVAKILKSFELNHRNCQKSWNQPDVPKELSLDMKLIFWWHHGERGMSSECMAYHMAPKDVQEYMIKTEPEIKNRKNIPYDVSDFGRCYELIRNIPELRSLMDRNISPLSESWRSIVKQWDNLALLYEQGHNDKIHWQSLYEKLNQINKIPK